MPTKDEKQGNLFEGETENSFHSSFGEKKNFHPSEINCEKNVLVAKEKNLKLKNTTVKIFR